MKGHKVLTSSASVEWETPQAFFDKLNAEFYLTLDVAATKENSKCRKFIGADSLQKPWLGRCWMNPPYGRKIGLWVKKAFLTAHYGEALVVALLPARTDTRWFHDYIYGKAEIRFMKGRLKFGGSPHNAPFPNMVVIWTAKRKQLSSEGK